MTEDTKGTPAPDAGGSPEKPDPEAVKKAAAAKAAKVAAAKKGAAAKEAPKGSGLQAAMKAHYEKHPKRSSDALRTVSEYPIRDTFEKPSGITEMTRRGFLAFVSWLGLGWTAFAAGLGASLLAFQRFLFPNLLFEPSDSFKIGYPGDYPEIGKVYTHLKAKYGIWVVREAEGMFALIAICTHLGCPPNWLDGEQKFKCPCHGSGFRKSGINFEGPAPRPLERARILLADDGQVLVDKGKKFQQEKGQWEDSESYLLLG